VTNRRLVAVVAVAVLVVGAVAGVAVLGVFDNTQDDPPANESTAGDGGDRNVSFVTGDDDRVQVVSTGGQTVRGASDLPPGTRLEVRVTSTGSQPWARAETVTVGENGTFAATTDLSAAAWNETFQIEVVYAGNGTELANTTGAVIASEYLSNDPAVAMGRVSGDVVFVDAGGNRSVRGTTDLPPGTVLRIYFRSTGSDPFLEEFEATVDTEGTFAGTVDFGDVPTNTSFITVVSYAENGTKIVDTPGVVVPPDYQVD